MSSPDVPTYLLLDSQQGLNANDGWRVQRLQTLQVTDQGLGLTLAPSPPIPLKDAQGTLGGLTNLTGVAVDTDGTIYLADSTHHQIFKLTRREALQHWAHFFQVSGGVFANDRFVYLPTANRLERWAGALRRAPKTLAEVEVICETVWNETQARKLVLSWAAQPPTTPAASCCGQGESVQTLEAVAIAKEWDDIYPPELPAGELCQTSLDCLPCLGGLGSAPRQFNQPRGLAISARGDLYVADSKNNRIQVFRLRGLVLKAIWGKQTTSGSIPAPAGAFNDPWDVAVDRQGNVYIADKGNHRLQKFDRHRHQFSIIDGTVLSAHFFQVRYGSQKGDRLVFIPARHRLELWSRSLGRNPTNLSEVTTLSATVNTLEAARSLVLETIHAKGSKDILLEWETSYSLESDPAFDSPTHLAIDAEGRLYVVDQAKDFVKILDAEGHVLGQVTYVSEISGHFPPTAITIDADGKLIVVNAAGIHRFEIHLGESCHSCCGTWEGHCTGITTDAEGCLVAINESGKVAQVPAPKKFEKDGIYFSRPLDSNLYQCQWHKILLEFAADIPTGTSLTVWTYTAETIYIDGTTDEIDVQKLQETDWRTRQINAKDFLILSPPGRFLWLKIQFSGNGTETPVISHLQAYFPRLSYLQYLPAVYQADPISKDFLDRFLSIFEVIFSSIEINIDHLADYFDADGVPEKFLTWLASWVDMEFDPGWSVATRRRLLRHAAELYRQRGTPLGLKKFIWLAFGIQVQILEHFQLRRWLFLNQSLLGERSVLWGNQIVRRLQLEENARIGEFALVGTNDPLRDPFHVYAHRFSVFIPAALCRSTLAENRIRAVIEAEKPGHTDYTLCKVEPHFRVGVQSTVGLDTIVGRYPQVVLNADSGLGYDFVLSGDPEAGEPATLRVGTQSQVGVNTLVG